jgi:MFS family permease
LGRPILKDQLTFFYVCLTLLIATYLGVGRLIASRFGRVLRGLKDNETRMQAIGFRPYFYRLTAYVIAGTLCGLAGFLLGNQAEFVSPAYMHWQRSGELIIMVLLGGTGTLYGPMLGALALLLLEEALSRLTEHWKVMLGPALVLIALFASGGIAGAIAAWRRRRRTPARLAHTLPRVARHLFGVGLKASRCWRREGRRLLLRPAHRLRRGAQAARAACEPAKTALGRALEALPPLAERAVKTTVVRWWRR